MSECGVESARRDRDRERERDPRDRRDRRDARPARPRTMETSAAAAPAMPSPRDVQALAEAADLRAAEHADAVAANAASVVAATAPLSSGAEPENAAVPPRTAEVVEQSPRDAPAAAARLGSEGLQRLRTRYTDVVNRIKEKTQDDEERTRLIAAAERLNPDGWGSPDEVSAALEQYETVFESLRSVVGRHPRRRG
jgi:hypothetical protein